VDPLSLPMPTFISVRKGSVSVKARHAKLHECVGRSPSLAAFPVVRLNRGCDDELSIGDYNVRTAIAVRGSDMIFVVDCIVRLCTGQNHQVQCMALLAHTFPQRSTSSATPTPTLLSSPILPFPYALAISDATPLTRRTQRPFRRYPKRRVSLRPCGLPCSADIFQGQRCTTRCGRLTESSSHVSDSSQISQHLFYTHWNVLLDQLAN
jgi:hypothetical protein